MTAVTFLEVKSISSLPVNITDLGFRLERSEARDLLGAFTLKQVMESSSLATLLDNKMILIDIKLDDDLRVLSSSTALRWALKEIVKCHTCGK